MFTTIESKGDIKYIQMLPAPTEGATENIRKGSHYRERRNSKKPRTLEIDIFEIPDKIKILENCFRNMN